MNPRPVGHRVEIRWDDGRLHSLFVTPYPEDAGRYLAALGAANPHLHGVLTPVVEPAIAQELKEVAA